MVESENSKKLRVLQQRIFKKNVGMALQRNRKGGLFNSQSNPNINRSLSKNNKTNSKLILGLVTSKFKENKRYVNQRLKSMGSQSIEVNNVNKTIIKKSVPGKRKSLFKEFSTHMYYNLKERIESKKSFKSINYQRFNFIKTRVRLFEDEENGKSICTSMINPQCHFNIRMKRKYSRLPPLRNFSDIDANYINERIKPKEPSHHLFSSFYLLPKIIGSFYEEEEVFINLKTVAIANTFISLTMNNYIRTVVKSKKFKRYKYMNKKIGFKNGGNKISNVRRSIKKEKAVFADKEKAQVKSARKKKKKSKKKMNEARRWLSLINSLLLTSLKDCDNIGYYDFILVKTKEIQQFDVIGNREAQEHLDYFIYKIENDIRRSRKLNRISMPNKL